LVPRVEIPVSFAPSNLSLRKIVEDATTPGEFVLA